MAPVDDAGACNDIVVQGSMVTPTCVDSEPPEPQGGTIQDGVYTLQSVALYDGCPVEFVYTTTWDICGTEWLVAQTSFADGASTTARVNFGAQVGSTSVVLAPTCMADITAVTETRGYTATGGQLLFFQDINGAVSVGTYQRR